MELKMASNTAAVVVNHVENNKYQYSKVSLSLENCILPPEKLFPSPSQIDGLEREHEIELRILGCELIQTSGILLRLPQVAMATGQVLFQRFYYSKSFVRHSMEVVAMACITLASKIEEAPRRIRDVVNVFHHIKQVKAGKTIQPLILDQNYINLKNQVIKAERRVLKELGFCVHVKHPHKILRKQIMIADAAKTAFPSRTVPFASLLLHGDKIDGLMYLFIRGLRPYYVSLDNWGFTFQPNCLTTEQKQVPSIELLIIVTLLEVLKVKNKKLMQTAWNYMNDSLRTEVFVRYDPETIACACIYLSARLLQIPLPNKPAWYFVFAVSEQDINDICQSILSLYSRKKPDPDKLEKIVEDLRKTHQEAKLKAKGLSAQNNLANLSPASQVCSPRNGTKSPVNEAKKEKIDSKHNEVSPKYSKELNHRKRRSSSPLDDDYQSSEGGKKRTKTSSSGSATSHSPSPKRKQKTPPRGFKDSRHSRSRSRSKGRSSKKTKHRSSHKRKHSHSLSPSSPTHVVGKKSYKSKHSDKSHHTRSRSRSHERNHHSNSLHQKAHKSRKDKVKENHHSREKKRR